MFLKLCLLVMLNNFIDDLYLVVCLRVINRKEAFLDTKFITEFSDLFTIELRVVV